MLILKNLAINLYLISDPKYGIPYRKKQKKLQLLQHSKLRWNVGNIFAHVRFAELGMYMFNIGILTGIRQELLFYILQFSFIWQNFFWLVFWTCRFLKVGPIILPVLVCSSIRYFVRSFVHPTVKNTVILPNFLVWIFCGKAQFRANRLKLCGNCAFPQNFHTRKLDEELVFFAVSVSLEFFSDLTDCFFFWFFAWS